MYPKHISSAYILILSTDLSIRIGYVQNQDECHYRIPTREQSDSEYSSASPVKFLPRGLCESHTDRVEESVCLFSSFLASIESITQ